VRNFLLTPLALVLTAACGTAACRAGARDPHLFEMSLAVTAMLIASALAVAPLLLMRGQDQLAVVQASLLGSVAHILASAMLGGLTVLMKVAPNPQSFLLWLLACYLVSLCTLALTYVRFIRSAPPHVAQAAKN
jgi:hypothetical protein